MGAGRHRGGSAGREPLSRRHRKAVALGIGLTSLVLLATVLVAKGWTDDGAVRGPRVPWGAPTTGAAHPSRAGAPAGAALGLP